MNTDKLIELFLIIGICFSVISATCDYKKEEYNTDINENLHAAVGMYILSVDEHLDSHLHQNYNNTLNLSEIARFLNIDDTDVVGKLGNNFSADPYKVYMIRGTSLVNVANDLQNKRDFWIISQYIAMICALVSNVIAIILVLKRKEKECYLK